MKLRIEGGLPWVAAVIRHGGRELRLERVLIDTGSAGTLLRVDHVLALGLEPAPDDPIYRMRGVGGVELVIGKRIDRLSVGEAGMESFQDQVGAMEYGFPIDGLLGTDFLRAVGAVLDFRTAEAPEA